MTVAQTLVCEHGHQARKCPHCDALRAHDALDHIMRVARGSIQPTRRLDWIALRAQYALEGKEWSRDVRETPKDRVQERENLRARLAAVCKQRDALESLLCAIYDELQPYENTRDDLDSLPAPNFAMSIRQRIDEVLP